MFPIIPHHINNKIQTPTKNTEQTKGKLLKPCEKETIFKIEKQTTTPKLIPELSYVTSASFLPKNTVSSVFQISDIINGHSLLTEKNIYIKLKNGFLKSNSEKCWIKLIRISNDIHSSNALLEIINENSLQLRLIKDVMINQEFNLWFSEEVLRLMNITFLTPTNIQGQNRYVCHICGKVYENPNPLKIHLSTNCNKNSIDCLWTKLCLNLNNIDKRNTNNTIWSSSSSSSSSSSHLNIPTFSINSLQSYIWKDTSRLSAFHPIPKVNCSLENNIQTTTIMDTTAAASAHLETIVSNMGTSKQGGHLCIYCGKLYSRKYGLKIHIRTHSGYKPLKCKYCFRPFGDPSNLNKHVRLHLQNSSTYKCDICNKILIRRRDLERHIQSRHSEINLNKLQNTSISSA